MRKIVEILEKMVNNRMTVAQSLAKVSGFYLNLKLWRVKEVLFAVFPFLCSYNHVTVPCGFTILEILTNFASFQAVNTHLYSNSRSAYLPQQVRLTCCSNNTLTYLIKYYRYMPYFVIVLNFLRNHIWHPPFWF